VNDTLFNAFISELDTIEKEASKLFKSGPGKLKRLERKAGVASGKAQKAIIKKAPGVALTVGGSLSALSGAHAAGQRNISPPKVSSPTRVVERLSKPEIDKIVDKGKNQRADASYEKQEAAWKKGNPYRHAYRPASYAGNVEEQKAWEDADRFVKAEKARHKKMETPALEDRQRKALKRAGRVIKD